MVMTINNLFRHAQTTGVRAFSAEPEQMVDGEDVYLERFEGYRREGTYTPFELIEYTDKALKHEIKVQVNAPIDKCYAIWSDRLNWLQWFDMIEEMGFHEDDPDLVSVFIMYRWARTPFLELYTTFRRTEAIPNECILEEPVEGTPLVAAVLFQTTAEAGVEGPAVEGGPPAMDGTVVTLRVSYQLATVLDEFAGPMAVYADVDEKLRVCMGRMAAFVEGVDAQALAECRGKDKDFIVSGFPQQRERRRQAEVDRQEAIAAHDTRVENVQATLMQRRRELVVSAAESAAEAEEEASAERAAAERTAAAAAGAAAAKAKASTKAGRKVSTKRGRKSKKPKD